MSDNYLRWVGGKTGVADQILPHFPQDIDTYVEPFVGSGAMFFEWYRSLERKANNNMMSTVHFPSKITLCDINQHLVNCHMMVRDRCDDVIARVMQMQSEHNTLGKDYLPMYKRVRASVTDEITSSNQVELAAQFIYINKTCFNGIWRVNRAGKNNVPPNKREQIRFDENAIRDASRILKKAMIRNVSFTNMGFAPCEGLFVYMDPPYYPISKTSSFASYNKERENDDNLLARLKTFCDILDNAKIKWLMSNSNAASVLSTFSKYNIQEINAHRFVRAIKNPNEKREKIVETIIKNY